MPGFSLPKVKAFLTRVGIFFSIIFVLNTVPALSKEVLDSPINSDEDIDAELKYLQEETYVITGTRIPQKIEKTSHSVFVVTDREIQQMGARFLTDVIPIVPGWHIFTNAGKMDTMLARGAGVSWGSDILVMVNNLKLTLPGGTYRLLSIENAKRIEFVSGPGSASYGSNAMSGVINIITKEGKDVDGAEVSVRGGSYDTRQTNILFGKAFKDLEIAANFNYFETDGYDGKVQEDAQTALDTMFGTSASMAPGKIKGDADKYDGQFKMAYKGLTFDSRYHNHSYDWPLGSRNILDEETNYESINYYLNLTYEFSFWEGFDLISKVYREHKENESFVQAYPEGSIVGTPSGFTVLAEPMFQHWIAKSNRTGFETQATYDINDANTLVVGCMYEEEKALEWNFEGNYIPTDDSFIIIPLSSFQEFPDEFNWDIPSEFNFKAVFVEDVWDVFKNLRLDIGARYDYYSDFGGELSPRAGVKWDVVENIYVKFNYGHAFRAPDVMERYFPKWGNENLDPETEDSYELAFGVRFLPSFTGQITGFYREIKDSIVWVYGSKAFNAGKTIDRGVEIQLKYDFGRGSYLSLNYTQIDPDESAYIQPEKMGAVMANIRLNQHLNLNTHCLYRGGWHRQEDDPKDDMKDYVVVNTKLTARKFLKGFDGLELGISVFNLFDEDYLEPSDQNGGLPDDFPMPGRNYMFELRYVY